MEKSFLPKKVRQVCARLSFGVLATNIVLSSLVAGLPVFMPVAFAASLTAATGGSSIASSTVGGSWTSLTGPTVTAIDDNDMSASSGVITLTAPSGFEFDTGGTAPTVRVNCTNSCGGGANNNVNNLTNNSTIAVVATSTTLTATITDDVDGGSTENSLTWQNVRVRPTAVTPLASGNIVRSGISFSGVSTSNYGALTETGPTCNGSNGTIVVVNGTIYGGPMNGLAYNNILIGTSGNDVIVSGNGDSYIDGLGGNDTICGGNGSDILNGGDGNDTIFGGNSSDSITGGSGNDTLNGDNSNDVIYGGSGTDNCSGGSGSDDIGGCGGDNEGTEVGSISVTKDASPNSAQDFNFTGSWSFTRDDDSDATLPNNFLVAATDDSTRTVTESVTSGWSLTGLSCTGGGGDSSTDLGTRTATINIDADEEVVCTYTNSQPTTIILEKQTLPDGDTSTFTFTGDLASTTMVDGSQMSSTVTPGTYTTTEVVPEGWKVQSIVCDSGATGNVETATATFTPSAGQTVKCVFTNIKKSHLGFTKTTIGGDGTFAITGDNGAGSFSIDTSDGTGTAGVDMFVDNATTFTFTETLTEEQIAAGWVNHSSACSFTVQPGQSIPNACTFNNTKKAHIHIVKQAVGGDATFGFHGANASGLGSESTFSIDTTSESDSFDVWVDTNVAVDFNITEDTLGGWTPAAGNTCAGSGDEQL